MTKAQATADVFLLALKGLPKKERDAVLVRIARDKSLGNDLLDLVMIERRRSERSTEFKEFLTLRQA